jgi:SpoVK/Ycf46/Vps4 family AAA+-type ATPase
MPTGWKIATPGSTRAAGHHAKVGARKPEQSGATPPSEEDQPVFSAEDPIRALDDVIVPAVVRERIESALSLIRNHETLFLTWNLAKIDPYHKGTAINFYGPSGTGKSLCAEAVAHEIGRPFINVNYAQIESRYVGQTPKNIESAFDAARAQDAVLIFDEADAMLGSRLSNVTQSADHAVNVSRTTMLRQLDRFDGLVVFTTNFPENYDAAFVRRILTHIRFELPDHETLRRLWTHMIPAELPMARDVDLDTLAEESDGLAGGDLVNVVIRAATTAVNRAAEHRKVMLDDLRKEVKSARLARAEIGKPPAGAQIISWRPADISQDHEADKVPG